MNAKCPVSLTSISLLPSVRWTVYVTLPLTVLPSNAAP